MIKTIFYNRDNVIPFDIIGQEEIKTASSEVINNINTKLQQIYTCSESSRNFENTMLALDDIHFAIENVYSVTMLLAYTHPEKTVLTEAQTQLATLEKKMHELSLDENLYDAVKQFSQTKEATELIGYKKKYLTETLDNFHRNGMKLSKTDREKLMELKNKLSETGIQFDANIASYKDSLIVADDEIAGLPDDYKDGHKKENGTFEIDLSYPSYRPFMKYSQSDSARKALYLKFSNRAADKNLGLLNEMLLLRKEISHLLGFKSYAEFALEDKMAKKPAKVWKFEEELTSKIEEKYNVDVKELLQAKEKHLQTNVSEINVWESSFYQQLVLEKNYQVNEEEVKEYFPLSNVIEGIFSISNHLYDIRFQENNTAPKWHKDVLVYEIFAKDTLKGRFYLDLFPRDNKYNHAAMFPIISGKQINGDYTVPTAALVCNFPKPSKDKPSLLPHDEVITLFHEFGHLLHDLLTEAPLASMSGTSTALDFVETPSQLFENWAWDYESLKLFAKHYKTKELLPKELHQRMLKSKNAGEGIHTRQQIFYGTLDMTLHDNFDPNGSKTTTDVVKELQNKLTPFSYVPGTHFEASFGHLNGYAAGYYGYLWAKVYAEDIFSVFKSNGVLNKDDGKKYLEHILSKGSSVDEFNQVKQFLGREPNEDAFIESITG